MLTGQAVNTHPGNPDLSNVSKEYWQFADIFCKKKAKNLPILSQKATYWFVIWYLNIQKGLESEF